MSETSPGGISRGLSVPRDQWQCTSQPLHQADCLRALHTLTQTLNTAFGPVASTKLIHNKKGGHVTVTSTSSRILKTLSLSQPVLKLLVTAVQGHLSQHSDGGLFSLLFSLSLIQKSLAAQLHGKLVMEVNEFIMKVSLEYLEADNSPCIVDLDTTHVDGLLTLISSIISAKPGCLLKKKDIGHLSRLLLQATLNITGQGCPPNSIQYVCLEGKPPSESLLYSGILLPTPQFPAYRTKPLEVRTAEVTTTEGAIRRDIMVALISASLSGDSKDFLETGYELEDGECSLSGAVLEKVSSLVHQLAGLGVGLMLCQKVVHPRIKRLIKQQGMLVLDRLGLSAITAAHALAGGTLISSCLTGVDSDLDLGHLGKVTLLSLGQHSYVHLEAVSGGPSPVSTLLLCHNSEESLEELKSALQNAHHVVGQSMQRPRALAGGGAWQTHLAGHLLSQVEELKTSWSQKLGCSDFQVQKVGNIFVESLLHLAAAVNKETRDSAANFQSASPGAPDAKDPTPQDTNLCAPERQKLRGILESKQNDLLRSLTGDSEVLDGYDAWISALRTGVAAANMVLGIQHCIQNTN